MTQEEIDAQVGRVLRESKEAEATLNRLIIQFQNIGADIAKLAKEVSDRAARAKRASSTDPPKVDWHQGGETTMPDAGIEFLRNYAAAVDLDAIDKLDREIGLAVANVAKLREQRRQLGI